MVFVQIFSWWIYLLLFPHCLIVLFLFYLHVYVLPPCNPAWAESDCCNGVRPNLEPYSALAQAGSVRPGRQSRDGIGEDAKEEENLSMND